MGRNSNECENMFEAFRKGSWPNSLHAQKNPEVREIESLRRTVPAF